MLPLKRHAKTLKELCPPFLHRLLRPGLRYVGDYQSWAEARAASSGYDSSLILEKVSASCEKVIAGEAAFERDSVAFETPEYNWSLISALLLAAGGLREGEPLRVLDFGGSLGSSYYQNRKLLPSDLGLRWMVVEQDAFVERGAARFSNAELSFRKSIEDCGAPDVVLLCSVLQYLPEPWRVFESLLKLEPSFLYMDRTPFIVGGSADRLCVQHVPPSIYAASYPAWIFSKASLAAHLPSSATRIAELAGTGGCFALSNPSGEAEEKGFLWKLEAAR